MKKQKKQNNEVVVDNIQQDKMEQLENIEQSKKKQKKEKRVKEITKKRFWLNIVAFAVMGCLSGIFVGNYIVETFMTKVDYSIYDEVALRAGDDVSAIARKSMEDRTSAEMFVLAEQILTDTLYYKVSGTGSVTNPVKDQKVWSENVRQDNTYTSTQISVGVKNVAFRTQYTVGSEAVVTSGSPGKNGEATWDGQSNTLSVDKYKEEWGCPPTGVIPYIACTRTVLTQKKEKLNDGYKCTITLHPQASVVNYVKQMSKVSGIDAPKFLSISIDFEIDNNNRFRKIMITESYKVNYGVTVTCGGTLDMVFEYDIA